MLILININKSCLHQESQKINTVLTCKNCSVYIGDYITGLKEDSFNQYGDLPLEEHWVELIKDEVLLCQPFTKEQSGFTDLRKSLIEWIFNLGDKLKQRSLTLQLAIIFLDKLFLAGHTAVIEKDKYLWGLTALLLASKYDEIDNNIPYIHDFKKISSRANYSRDQILKCESMFAEHLKWSLMVICPLNYTYALLTFGVIFSNDKFKYKTSLLKSLDKEGKQKLPDEDKLIEITNNKIKSVRKYCEFYTDMALQSYDCQQYKYSIQSLSAVVAARKT